MLTDPLKAPLDAMVDFPTADILSQNLSSAPGMSASRIERLRYKYGPLESAENFRLITLKPGKLVDEIQCFLSIVSLSAHPSYDGLSYTWGTNEKTHEIFQEGELVLVTANLHAALRRLRHPHEARTLWVDAICIKQQDFAERSQQVMIMGTIFKEATKVLVWLGEEGEGDKEALEMIELFEDESGSVGFPEFTGSDVLSANATRPWSGPSLFLGLSEGWIYSRGLSSLLARPWFTRSWVVQEVVLASQVQVVSGTRSCSWSALSRLAFYLNSNPVATFGSLVRPIIVLTYLRRKQAQQEAQQEIERDLSAMDLLDFTRIFEYTVPHDKDFAFLGLQSFRNDTGTVVDYELPCKEVFISIAQRMILQPQLVLYLLSLSGYTSETSDMNRPSWVPDWSAKPAGTSGLKVLQRRDKYKAAADSIAEVSFGSLPQTIVISGYLFDSIEKVSDRPMILIRDDHNEGQLERAKKRNEFWRGLFNTCYEIAVDSQPYPTGEEWLPAYARLLVGNMARSHNERVELPEQFFVEGYLAIMKVMEILKGAYQTGEISDENCGILSASLDKVNQYEPNVWEVAEGRRFCASSKKYLGWVPGFAEFGDLICIFKGSSVPYVLRRAESNSYILIGEC